MEYSALTPALPELFPALEKLRQRAFHATGGESSQLAFGLSGYAPLPHKSGAYRHQESTTDNPPRSAATYLTQRVLASARPSRGP